MSTTRILLKAKFARVIKVLKFGIDLQKRKKRKLLRDGNFLYPPLAEVRVKLSFPRNVTWPSPPADFTVRRAPASFSISRSTSLGIYCSANLHFPQDDQLILQLIWEKSVGSFTSSDRTTNAGLVRCQSLSIVFLPPKWTFQPTVRLSSQIFDRWRLSGRRVSTQRTFQLTGHKVYFWRSCRWVVTQCDPVQSGPVQSWTQLLWATINYIPWWLSA